MGAEGNDAYLKIPRNVRTGEKVSAKAANEIRKALRVLDGEVRRRTPRPSVSHGVRRSAGGFQIFSRGLERDREQVCGFMPVARGLGESGMETPGVGLVLGRVIALGTGEATVLIPTLDAVALDAAVPPREVLAEGDWEAWLTGTAAAVEVDFVASGDPAPTDGDWQLRVATFTVTDPVSPAVVPKVTAVTQKVHDEVILGGGTQCTLGGGLLEAATEGDVYVRAGWIHAAGTHTLVGGSAEEFTPAIGDTIWAEVTIEAELDDGLLTGNWTASLAQLGSGTLPADHAWTELAETGKAYAPLGNWIDDGLGNPLWEYSGCGDVTFLFCAMTTKAGHANYYRG